MNCCRPFLLLFFLCSFGQISWGQDRVNLAVEEAEAGQVRFSWSDPRFALEQTTDLSENGTWTLVTAQPRTEVGVVSVTVPTDRQRQFFRLRFLPSDGLPPDPSSVAPPIVGGVATAFTASIEFLYTGGNAIQTGVTNGTIAPIRAAVLRGRVVSTDNAPLSGVAISILDHPEFGRTLTRADGGFDLVVNGGGVRTVVYEKSGFLTAQRQMNTAWQEYVLLPEVALVPLDPVVTPVAFGPAAPIQVARSSVQTDEAGTRSSTLIFPAATAVSLKLPNGSTQQVTSLKIRATEYTVGPNGPKAMPALLPPTSAYTYCVELSADEAIAAGASEIRFDRPVFHYVENFLGFPVGTVVPTGYYDRQRAVWAASENGVVMKILAINGGVADLDLDGNGAVDAEALLTQHGVTTAERQQLANLYPAGQTLWRVPIKHFTPIDENWPFWPPADAREPDQPPPVDEQTMNECFDEATGSIIECQNQILGESIPITGTPFSLNYRSNRTPGWLPSNILPISLSGATVPPSLKRIELTLEIAGRRIDQTFPPQPNQQTVFTWDGIDAYGRELSGRQKLSGSIRYIYQTVFAEPDPAEAAFARPGRRPLVVLSRGEFALSQRIETTLGRFDARPLGLGGWTLSPQHSYDSVAQSVYLGTGRRQGASSLEAVVGTVAGTGAVSPFNGDGIAATAANIGPIGMAVGPDGSVYITDFSNKRIRRVGPGGIISTLAGTGQRGFNGDGIPALQANLDFPSRVVLGPDGGVYFADIDQRRIRRIGPDGLISTVAGTGNFNYNGDGIPAVEANLHSPIDLAFGPDGSLYIVDSGHDIVRRVDPSGIISTFAGRHDFGSHSPDGVLATDVYLRPSRVVAGPDGAVYISAEFKVRRVGPDGIISTVAGTGERGDFNGDGIPAINAHVVPGALAIDPDGSLYISDAFRIRRVDPDGIITTIAGTGFAREFEGNGRPALATSVLVAAMDIAPDGTLYFADELTSRIRRIRSRLPALTVGDFTLASEDGYHLYEFSDDGRHQRTFHTLTGAVLYEFTYDADGRLTSVIEKTGGTDNITTIEHDAAGNPRAVVSPYGQRTELSVDHDGYLARVVNPAGDIIQLTTSTNGLLQVYTDPRGNRSEYTFDSEGRLVRADAPGDGFQTFSRSSNSNSFTVVRSTALNRTNIYHVEELADGAMRSVTTLPDGSSKEAVRSPAGGGTATQADGTTFSTVLIPDPRFGMQAPLASSVKLSLPSALTFSVSNRLAVFISNRFDILSVTNQTARTTIAGETTTNIYRSGSRTFTHTTAVGRSNIVTIDALGRWTRSRYGNLAPISLTYDQRGRISTMSAGTDGSMRTLSFTYNGSGLLETLTDPIGRTAQFAYDAAGRLISKTLPDRRILTIGYDRAGNPTTITPPGRSPYTLGYSELNDLNEFTPPALPDSGSNVIQYDAEGAVTNITRAGGEEIRIGYDPAGRATTRRLTAGVSTLNDSFGYDTAGRLTNITSADGVSLDVSYDGSLPLATRWSGAVAGEVSRTYDQSLRLATQAVNGANPVTFSYDADGLLKNAGNLALVRNNQNGLATQSTLETVRANRAFNQFGEMTNYTVNVAAGVLYEARYIRDALGRIVQKVETIEGTTDTFAYGYDLAGQLTNVTKNGTLSESYTYDDSGNCIRAQLNGTPISATYDAQDRVVQFGARTYSYTAAGDLLSKSSPSGTTHYNYDPLGNLRSATVPDGTSVTYVIDGLNRRVGRKVNGVHQQSWLYDDLLRLVAELDGTGAIVSRFVYTGGHVPAYLQKGNVTFRIIADQVGSVRLVVNAASGAIAQQLDYDGFGRVISDSSPGFQPFGFAGGLYDPATKLVHFGTRDYDPEAGRWTTQDKALFAGNDANLYRYCHNDPVNFVDPTGLDNWDAAQGFVDQLNEEIQLIANPMLGLHLLIDSLVKAGARTLGFDPGPTMREIMFHSSPTTADRKSEDYATGELAGVCVGVVGQLFTGGLMQRGAALEAERLARQGRIAERFAASEGQKVNFGDLRTAAAELRNNGRRFEQAVQEEVVEVLKGWKSGNGGSGIGGGGGW